MIHLKKYIKNLIVILAMASLIFSGGCKEKSDEGDQKIKVVTTIGMISDVVKNIGGDLVHVDGLMGPGVDPHLYRASESDVSKLSKAKVIFYCGLHLESKMIDIFEKMKRSKKTVPITLKIDTKKLHKPAEYEGYYDPHIWFDVPLWSETIDIIVETLSEVSPENKTDFEKRGAAYKSKLISLHHWIEKELRALPKNERILVTAHDAFGYFGSAYDFEVMGLQGISTESEAGTRDVQELAATIAKRKIPAIFIESSIPKRNVEAVQAAVRAKGWNVKIGGELFSDAMGTPGTEEGTYIGMVEHNVKTILKGLVKK